MDLNNKQDFINNIWEKIKNFEKERKSRLISLIWFEIITFLILCIGFYIINHTKNEMLSGILFLFNIFVIVILIVKPRTDNSEFKQYLKNTCNKIITETFGFESMKGHGFMQIELVNSDLFPTFNRIEDDDVIVGTYKNVEYKVADTKLKTVGRKHDFTDFKGLILAFPSNKHFKGKTIITTKGDNNIRNYQTTQIKRFNWAIIIWAVLVGPLALIPILSWIMDILLWIGGHGSSHQVTMDEIIFYIIMTFGLIVIISIPVSMQLDNRKKKKKLEETKLEDISFEKRFNVDTDNQIEARYLLTPSFMERLKNLETAFGINKIKCSFFEDRIMFAIPSDKDFFELGSLYVPIEQKNIEIFYNEIQSIYDMIDHFKLDEKTGL